MMDERIIDLVISWRNDPVKFVIECLGVVPSPQQTEALRAFACDNARVAIKSGHGTGKSTLLSWLILWGITTHQHIKIPVTAPTAHQLSDVLWSEVRKWGDKLLEPWKSSLEITADMVRYSGASGFAVARTGRKESPEALQGFHDDNLFFLIDEASGVPDVVFQVAQGTLSTVGARVLMAANPTRNTGYFYDAFHRNRDRWQRLTFSCLDSPHVSPDYAVEIAEAYGADSDIYKVRVLGEFPSTSMAQLISPDLIDKSIRQAHRINVYGHMPKILGCDVSYFGDDSSVIYMRQGLVAQELWSSRNVDTAQFAQAIARIWRENECDACFVDVTGWGAGVVDTLRTLHFNPMPVYFGGSAGDSTRFVNKRVEMWWKMKEWLEAGGCVPDNTDLRDDLCAPEYYYSANGKIGLERKEDMRKRGLPSPDKADALAMTFAEEVQCNAMMDTLSLIPSRVKKDYNHLDRRGRSKR